MWRDFVNTLELASSYLFDIYKSMSEFISNKEYIKSIDYIYTEVGGRSFYIPYLFWRERSTILRTEVFGNKLSFPLSDKGLSYELILYGRREHKATEIFRKHLKELKTENDEINVIEVGANVGYYLTQEAEILDSNSYIYAYEPVPDTRHILEKNIRDNNIADMVDLIPFAASSERQRVEMDVNTASNWVRVTEEGGKDTVSIEAWPIDDYIEERGEDPMDINVVRMDVDGYEYEVLKGMEKVIDKSDSLLVFMELHASFLRNRGELHSLISYLERKNFSLVQATRRRSKLKLDSIEELKHVKGAPNIFLYKEKGGRS